MILTDVAPVILAAGESARMGFPKALLPLGRDTFLTRILDTLQEVDLPQPCVVLGTAAPQIQPLLSGRDVRILINHEPRQGQLSSIKLALRQLDPNCAGCLLWPVDQPSVSAQLVKELIELFVKRVALLVLPQCQGRRGHPAIFGRALFSEILAAPLQEGARGVVLRHSHDIVLLPTEELSTVLDIDTPDDYCRLTGETLEAALARRQ